MPTYTELTVVAQKKYRAAVVERFCYLTDGLTDPKLHDGTSLTNWGIQRPSTASVAAASSTGATDLDLCESLWTPVAVTLDDCEVPGHYQVPLRLLLMPYAKHLLILK